MVRMHDSQFLNIIEKPIEGECSEIKPEIDDDEDDENNSGNFFSTAICLAQHIFATFD